MKNFVGAVLFASVCVGLALADSPKAPINDPTDVASVKQLEHDIGNAMVGDDIERLNQIYAENFASVGSDGKVTTKKDLLSDVKSSRLECFELGPMDVQVFGNVAMAQGRVKEKRSQNGKETSGQFAWQDRLEKRGGKWVVVRSAGARVILPDTSNAQSQDPAVVAAIKKLQNDIGDAMVASDIDKLNRGYADDWATIDSDGKIFTKEGLLQDFKSGNHKLMWFKLGPIDLQVLGDVALVQTSVMEKRIQDGKGISGQFAFMDLLKKREGEWVIVRSLAARVE